MKEDTKILEDVLHDRDYLSERDFIAIENLLQAYKQDEKVIEEMAKVMCKFDCIPSKVTNYKDLIDYFRKGCE